MTILNLTVKDSELYEAEEHDNVAYDHELLVGLNKLANVLMKMTEDFSWWNISEFLLVIKTSN